MMLGPARWTEQYIRIPFVESGFTKMGCHCWGLVCLVFEKERQIELPKYDTITSAQIRQMIRAKDEQVVSGNWMPVIGEMQAFDVVTMKGDDDEGRSVERHVGVYAGNNFILHVEKGTDSKCDGLKNILFSSRVLRSFRYIQ